MASDAEMAGNLLARESSDSPNSYQPLLSRQPSKERRCDAGTILVAVAASTHELIRRKQHAVRREKP